MRQLACLLMLASPAWAETCPPPPDHSAALARLVDEVRAAPTAQAARPITDRMWELWADAPDEAAQEVLDAGLRKRASYDFLGALRDFDRLVEYCPDYAEGYNQRAFIHFIRQDYEAALEQLDIVLELNPAHIPALAGKALTLMGLDRMDEGQEVLRRALQLNPWLPERGLLIPRPGEKL
ncbi:tetratricopeptide repeat protein [Lutimaribacter saemankumensis]|uniref:Tetratricopeptide repeat-containing protein n=1 Tax=Lutimaribacter saemankumensis TaxID=490829 RepID=A0A1G8LKI4_9RHOB|nr:hypothetical protein [Lutimaribacter saemankumensis]SDI56186.1 Tetratricopeptide repeat-containing protein [Lutimaribacter saemankumensis]